MSKTACMKQTVLAALALSVLAVACQKELSLDSDNNVTTDLLASLEAKQPGPQTFSLATGVPSAITGQKGTRVDFPANAFVTKSGAPVSGAVSVELKEIYEVWEMVLHNKFTQVGLTPIESGGQFYLRATQNGQELKLAPSVTLTAALPTQNALPGMQVFNGSKLDTGGRSIFSWSLPPNTTTNRVNISLDSSGLQQYIMKFDSVGWINCDRFINEPMHTAQVRIANYLPGEDASVLMHFTGMKSVTRMWNENGLYKVQAPERAVTLVALASRNGELYAAFLPVQLQAGTTYSLTLAPMSEAEFGQKLRSLN
jgi:hypothetical protein